MTLSRAMSGDDDIEVLFNSETEEFSNMNAAIRRDPRWIRVAELFDDRRYMLLTRELPSSRRGIALQAKYDKVRAIRDYEVPVIRMVDHSFDEAVLAFERINTLATPLKRQDIQSARGAEAHAGLISDDVVPFMKSIEDGGFTRLNVMHLFRVCGFIAHPDGRDRKPLHELSRAEVESAWRATKRATTEAQHLLRAELGLVNMDILWSGAFLVPIIALLGTTRPRERDTSGMLGWLALAALRHRYSKSSESTLDQDLTACRRSDPVAALLTNLRNQGHSTSLLAKPADFTGSLSDKSGLLATYIACRQAGMRDLWTGQRIVLVDSIDRHHILPRRQFDERTRTSSDVVANIAFIKDEVNNAISNTGPEVYLSKVDEKLLESQAIPLNPSLWRIDHADEFFAARRKLLAASFNDFVREALPGRRL
jgi:hypothetical protein